MRCLDAAAVVLDGVSLRGFSREGVGIELSDLASGIFQNTIVDGFDTGIRLRDQAVLEFEAGTLSDNGAGLVAMGQSAVQLRGCVWAGNQVGLWTQERSSCQISKSRFRGQGHGLRLTQEAVIDAKYLRFTHHDIAVLLEDFSAASLGA